MSARSCAEDIWEDISYRAGIGNEADDISKVLRDQILEIWAEIIEKETHEAFRYFIGFHEQLAAT